jgi:hypothetical protein
LSNRVEDGQIAESHKEDAMISRREYDEPIMRSCFLCTQPFQFGPHTYLGKYIRQWDIEVCNHCYGGNLQDGIVLQQHPRLAEHLNTKGIKAQLNDKGWLDWPPY